VADVDRDGRRGDDLEGELGVLAQIAFDETVAAAVGVGGQDFVVGRGEAGELEGAAAGGFDGLAGEFAGEGDGDGGGGAALAGDGTGEGEERAGAGAYVGVGGVVIEADFVEDGVAGLGGFGSEEGEEAGAVLVLVGRGSDPVFAEREAGDAVDAAIVGDAAAGDAKREPGGVGDDVDAGQADAVFIENRAGDGAHAVEAEFGEESGIGEDVDGGAEALGPALAMGGGEVALALRFEQVEAVGKRRERELAGRAGAELTRLRRRAGSGNGDEPDDGAGERAAGGPVERDAGDDAGGEQGGGEKPEGEASHGQYPCEA